MTSNVKTSNHFLRTIIYTSVALIAFAANSVLCRKALGENKIDASGFTIIRLLSGIIMLLILLGLSKTRRNKETRGSWYSAGVLFLYAVTFSFAYITLDTGTGALIAFGSVQITIILYSIISGHKMHWMEGLGTMIAFSGFIYLIMPGVNSPSLKGFILMTIAGIAWGIYTLNGLDSKNPLKDTAYNFVRTFPFLILLFLFTMKDISYSIEGILLAVISGAVTSGIGYTIWYIALRGLTSVQSAVVQLLVPVIAAFGGVVFVSEVITFRLSLASLLILGGILVVTLGKKFTKKFQKQDL
jgi:drug/metabolite transporter (DMT)-like permease